MGMTASKVCARRGRRPYGQCHAGAAAPGWLYDIDSVTRWLQRLCGPGFRVRLLYQRWQRPAEAERRRLGLRPGHYAFVRHVQLLCGDQPWVFARTVIPRQTWRARRHLARLGERSLGEVLFTDRSARREALTVALLRRGEPLMQAVSTATREPPPTAWSRSSVFRLRGRPLLVSEVFLRPLSEP